MTTEPAPAGPAVSVPFSPGLARLAVMDLGSNSFRLVVFTTRPGVWWRRTDEIHEMVRIGAGLAESGRLGSKRMARALYTLDTYAHFCRATGLRAADIRPVATSAIRDASNQEDFLAAAEHMTGLAVRVLSTEEEARYGYLAAVNSTDLRNGAVLDLGGGSLQLVEVSGRQAGQLESWPLGTVRMTERFLPGEKAPGKQLKALRAHVRKVVGSASWLAGSGRHLVAIGGTVRNLAAAAQRAAELPSFGVQGFRLDRRALRGLIERLAELPTSQRGSVPGIKPDRADVILAGALTVEAVLEAGDWEGVEVTEAGLREGVFFEWYLDDARAPLLPDVRRASVLNLQGQYETDPAHVNHVARLALQMWDALADAGAHERDPVERELLWAASMLHDIGMTVDYDDHHKHSRYLILNAGLPGFSPRETALIAQAARYHRKGIPSLDELAPLGGKGDEPRLDRMAALLRVAEQLERSRDQAVREARLSLRDGAAQLELVGDEDFAVARWAAERQVDLFERAFGYQLQVVA